MHGDVKCDEMKDTLKHWRCWPEYVEQGSPTWCSRTPSRPQGPCMSPAGLFKK